MNSGPKILRVHIELRARLAEPEAGHVCGDGHLHAALNIRVLSDATPAMTVNTSQEKNRCR